MVIAVSHNFKNICPSIKLLHCFWKKINFKPLKLSFIFILYLLNNFYMQLILDFNIDQKITWILKSYYSNDKGMKFTFQNHLNENSEQFLKDLILQLIFNQIKLAILLPILPKMKIQSNGLLPNVKSDGRKIVEMYQLL
jgi:hypothetical protein